MIHALIGLALITGITIAITLFVQHQRDRRMARYHERRKRELLSQDGPPPPQAPTSPFWAWSCVGIAAAICFVVFNALASH